MPPQGEQLPDDADAPSSSASETEDDGLVQKDSDLQLGIFSHDNLLPDTDDHDEGSGEEALSDAPEEDTKDTAAPTKHDPDSDDEFELHDDTAPQQPGDRYFSDTIDTGITCHECGKVGHIARECGNASNQPCFLCGQLGHSRMDCPNDLCYNCLRPGHKSRDCQRPKRRRFTGINELCNNCGLPGHVQRDCSLSWRQYTFKKELTRHSVSKEAVNGLTTACYHCASSEHFGDECPERTWGGYSIFHRPAYEYLELVAYRVADGRRARSRSPRKQPKYHGNMVVDYRKPPGFASAHMQADGADADHKQHQTGNRPVYRGGYKNKHPHE